MADLFEPAARDLRPNWAGEFSSYEEWSLYAHRVNKDGVCIDAAGRRCIISAEFARARDEGAFPVRYFWNFCEPEPQEDNLRG